MVLIVRQNYNKIFRSLLSSKSKFFRRQNIMLHERQRRRRRYRSYAIAMPFAKIIVSLDHYHLTRTILSIRQLDTTNISKGFGNSETNITHMGTISWNIIDDQGINRQINIPNSYLVPKAGVRLLSPQHWSQEMNEVNNEGIICVTYGDKIVIKWNNQRYMKTVPIIKTSCNTGILWVNSKYDKSKLFATKFTQQQVLIAKDDNNNNSTIEEDEDSFTEEEHYTMKHSVIDYDEEIYEIHHTTIRNERELLLYHEKLGHMPFKLIQHAATNNILPKRLAKCKIPICPACLYGKMTRKPWRTSNTIHKISHTTIPGEFVSVDQM
jgi:hypothetical protein